MYGIQKVDKGQIYKKYDYNDWIGIEDYKYHNDDAPAHQEQRHVQ